MRDIRRQVVGEGEEEQRVSNRVQCPCDRAFSPTLATKTVIGSSLVRAVLLDVTIKVASLVDDDVNGLQGTRKTNRRKETAVVTITNTR